MAGKKYTLRKFINDIHLWLGIGSGLLLFFICLSGSILVFVEEIKSLFAEYIPVSLGSDPLSIEDMVKILDNEGQVLRVSISSEIEKPYQFSIKTSPEDRRGTLFFMDQYSGSYTKSPPNSTDGFFLTMFKMHRWLLLDIPIGRPIVGIATIIFMVLSISGIVLWFPNKKLSKLKWKSLKPGFNIALRAQWKRINHDLHVTLGFYSAIFLLIMSLTGLFWSFEWYKDAGSAVLGTTVFGNRGGGPKVDSRVAVGSGSIDFAEVLKITKSELAFEGTTVLQIPERENEVFRVRKIHDHDFVTSATDELEIDRDGKILSKAVFTEKPLNEKIATSIRAIHVGSIFGWFSKTIYFISCLIATSLPVTGVIIWINKLKKKKRKKRSNSSSRKGFRFSKKI